MPVRFNLSALLFNRETLFFSHNTSASTAAASAAEFQRQGDPLSSMLFVLVMEVINHIVCWLDSEGLLAQLGSAAVQQRASLYADDLIFFVVPNENDLLVLRSILHIFGLA
jgi:hypothetical protein